MSKIVVVNGSARIKGNTMSMVKVFEEQMRKMDPSVEFEYIHLIQKNFGYCLSCNQCLLKGPDQCLNRDDAREILEKMHSADGLVFASPGYGAMVSALFKNLLDRFMYLDHMVEFEGVPAVIISTSGGDGVTGAPKYMADRAIRWWGCNIIDKIGIGHAFYVMNEKSKAKGNKRLEKAAISMLKEIEAEKPMKPTFLSYMYFIFNKTEGEVSPSAQPARYEHWVYRGWFNKSYYYDTKINIFYKMLGKFFNVTMKFVFKLLLGKDADQKLGAWTHNNY
ncbi:MAG: NAD(P)H-dependent oxidoreductase [Clostridia bacterium]|nr:NAD(P)H-dependent oxidoreductase [Clostridia bacterium]